MNPRFFIYTFSVLLVICISCKHEIPQPKAIADGGYPEEVNKIIITRCVDGCHDAANYKASGNLQLDTWEHLLQGGSNGASIVAYSPEYSVLMTRINIDNGRTFRLPGDGLNDVHGVTSNSTFTTIYAASQYGNIIHELFDADRGVIKLDDNPLTNQNSPIHPTLTSC